MTAIVVLKRIVAAFEFRCSTMFQPPTESPKQPASLRRLPLVSGWTEGLDARGNSLNVGATGKLDAVGDGLEDFIECLLDGLRFP